MTQKKMILIGVLVIVFGGFSLLFLIGAATEKHQASTTVAVNGPSVEIGGRKITVEIADDDGERRLGLSFKESMDRDKGMLFVMPRREVANFWMKDMRFPLDIVWIADGRVVNISENLAPEDSTPERSYSAVEPVDHVLELNAGMVDEWGIKIGNGMTINN